MPTKIILIGPMGAGKSTIGKALAAKLGLPFSDTDQLIEEKEGHPISEIFLERGEPYFRNIESEVVQKAVNDLEVSEEGVLSLGGGAIVNELTQDLLKKTRARKIFLDITLSAVAPRVGFDNARPLLLVNPRQKWNELMIARRPIYESLADLTIDVSDLSKEEVLTQIADSL